MAKAAVLPDHRKLFQAMLLKTLLLPVLLLIFFVAAPTWYGSKIHESLRQEILTSNEISAEKKAEEIAFFDKVDLQEVCFYPTPRLEHLSEGFREDGISGTFERLWWGRILSFGLVGLLAFAMLSITILNLGAKKSTGQLIKNYRLGWKIAMTTSLIKLILLIPLLGYGVFEFTILLINEFSPKLLLVIVIGGIAGLWASVKVLLKKVPLEFAEPMSREITPDEAPELWDAIRHAAATVQTSPPDRLVVGMQMNFFVTELAVKTETAHVTGRTLFLSYPLLKQLSAEEVLGIIGHELGHFKGNDTQMTREFYPLRLKVNETLMTLIHSGWVGWPSSGLLGFFNLSFERTIQEVSRQREFVADQVGASLTSANIFAGALVKFSVLAETLNRMLGSPVESQLQNPMAIRWHSFIDEKIQPGDPFWAQLGEKEVPHPLDSHPPLLDRLEALGNQVQVSDARQIALQDTASAYDLWFSGRDHLFVDLTQKLEKAVGAIRAKARLAQADYQTDEGKSFLEQQFPEVRWRKKGSGHLVGLLIFGIIALFCLLLIIVVPGVYPKVLLGAVVLLFVSIARSVWISRKDEIVLTAEGLLSPQWKQALRFSDVESIQLMRINYMLQMKFILKTKQPPLSKWAIPIASKVVLFPVRKGFSEKPEIIAQTIYRYTFRQPLA